MRSITRGRGLPRLAGIALLAVALGALAGAGVLPAREATAQANGTIVVQKQLVNAMGMPIAGGDLSGYVFTLTPLAGGTQVSMIPTNAAGTTTLSVAPGNYTITEQPRPGVTFQNVTLGGVPVGSFTVTSGMTTTLVANNQVAGTNSITITKQIVDANGAVVAGSDTSGFVFTVTGPNNFSQTLSTPVGGVITLTNLAPGQYVVTEQNRAGFTFVAAAVDGVPVGNPATFQILATATAPRQVLFQNRAGTATGTVRVTKEMVDASGNVTTGDRSGFQVTVTCGTAFSQSGTTDGSGIVQIANVPAGAGQNCVIRESDRTGFTLVSISPAGGADIGNGGAITVTAGQTLEVRIRNRAAAAQTDPVALFPGCGNVALTWPANTPITTVAAAITPAGSLEAIWRYDNAQGRFFAFSPNPNAPSDYTVTTAALEPVFLCMRSAGTLNRPRI